MDDQCLACLYPEHSKTCEWAKNDIGRSPIPHCYSILTALLKLLPVEVLEALLPLVSALTIATKELEQNKPKN